MSAAGPILRLFEVRVREGYDKELLGKFASTSAAVVRDEPGNLGYFLRKVVLSDDGVVVFASLWADLNAIQERFGENWQSPYLPPGYERLIDECSVRHIDVSSGWHFRRE
ncbi:MAG: antibiotic biosynthesis monooxygenase [Pseudomonadota bacterium]